MYHHRDGDIVIGIHTHTQTHYKLYQAEYQHGEHRRTRANRNVANLIAVPLICVRACKQTNGIHTHDKVLYVHAHTKWRQARTFRSNLLVY